MDVRIDKWLWAVRVYKSRSLATAACSAGKVRIGGEPLKPSRSVRIGDVISAATGDITRTVRVRAVLERRVGAKLVPEYMEDLTPASEYSKPREPDFRPLILRPKGAGRPTKKDRRKLNELI
jgi:ribosome-associated heat shock protein Hsp15